METYIYGLDRKAVIDVAVTDIVEDAMMKKQIKEKQREEVEKRAQEEEENIEGYMLRVRTMVRQTGILKEIPEEERKQVEQVRKKKCKHSG